MPGNAQGSLNHASTRECSEKRHFELQIEGAANRSLHGCCCVPITARCCCGAHPSGPTSPHSCWVTNPGACLSCPSPPNALGTAAKPR
eukprot:1159862-Pelagomonas_calceolata.AAC.1